MSQIIPMSADVLVEWTEPVDEVDGTFIGDDATGLVTLKTAAGVAVTGADELPATYAAGPPRRYYATIPNTVELTEGATYYVEFALTASDGTSHGFRRFAVEAAYEE
jgi:hypothetical protein